jgi:hypothetical protein
MLPIPYVSHPVQPLVVADSLTDFKVDPEHLAARHVAARFGLEPHVAALVAGLAGLGEVRQ